MRKIIVIALLLIGSINAKVLNKSVTITKAGIEYALDKNYSQLMKYSILTDKCFRALSEKRRDDLETCEDYQQITKDIQARIERLEDLKRR